MSRIIWYLVVYIIFITGISIIFEWLACKKSKRNNVQMFSEEQIDNILLRLKAELMSATKPLELYSNIYRKDTVEDDPLILEADAKLQTRINQYISVPDNTLALTQRKFTARPLDNYELKYKLLQ